LVDQLPNHRPDPARLSSANAFPIDRWHRSIKNQTLPNKLLISATARIGLQSLAAYNKQACSDENLNNLQPAHFRADRRVLQSGHKYTLHATENQTTNTH
jgi:hypothetical protein